MGAKPSHLILLLCLLIVAPAGASDILPDKSVQPSEILEGASATVILTIDADLDFEEDFPLDVVLVIDASSTMSEEMDTEATVKYFGALEVAEDIVAGLTPVSDKIALVSFATSAVQRTSLADNTLNDALAEIDAMELEAPGGMTSIDEGLEMARLHLEAFGRDDAVPVVILLSDGKQTSGDAEMQAGLIQQQGTEIVAISFGAVADQFPADLMIAIATSSDHHFHEPPNLGPVFTLLYDDIAGAVAARRVTVFEELGPGLSIAGPVSVDFFPGELGDPRSDEVPVVNGNEIELLVHTMKDDDAYEVSFEVSAMTCGEYLVDAESSHVEWIRPDGSEGSEPFPNETLTVLGDEPPEIACPADVEIEADAACQGHYPGPPATAESCDPDVEITPELPLLLSGAGDHVVEWVATDAVGSASCEQIVTVVDVTPPELSGVPANLVVECDAVPEPPPVTALDNCDAELPVEFEEQLIPGGCANEYTLERTWTATDAAGNEASATQTIQVVDTTPPEVIADPDGQVCLWPPNHKLVFLDGVTQNVLVVDNCDPTPALVTLGCESDQCDDAPCAEHPGENGDGSTVNDCLYDPEADVLAARSERAGTDPEGRDYSLLGQGVDACGNASDAVTVFSVHVPHDMSPHQECVSPSP